MSPSWLGFGKTFRQQIFICIVFGYFRGECHHLSGGSMTAHIGVAQVDIVFVNGYDTLMSVNKAPSFIRRARGYTPRPIPLAMDGPSVLAFGGFFKNTVCVLKGREAFLSQHVGSLDNVASLVFQEETLAHLLTILDVQPERVAHDLHPDFAFRRALP